VKKSLCSVELQIVNLGPAQVLQQKLGTQRVQAKVVKLPVIYVGGKLPVAYR